MDGTPKAEGVKPWKIPRSTFLKEEGRPFSFISRGRGPKKHACFLEGAVWNVSRLTPLGPRLTICPKTITYITAP